MFFVKQNKYFHLKFAQYYQLPVKGLFNIRYYNHINFLPKNELSSKNTQQNKKWFDEQEWFGVDCCYLLTDASMRIYDVCCIDAS